MLPLLLLLIALLGIAAGAVYLRRQPALSLRVRDLAAMRPAAGGTPWYASRGRSGMVILALIGALALWLLLSNLGLLQTRTPIAPGTFVVRIAPFRSAAEDQRQGALVAQQLVDALKSRVTTPINVGVLTTPVASAEEALALAQANGIDALIWGEVAAGTTADQAGLQPHLLWLPDEPFVPRTWQGFDGHFALPADYALSTQPLNGPAILPPLIDALNHFGRGDADYAATALARLRTDYGDVLSPELPAMVETLIFWAEGRLPDAETAARSALAAADRPQHRTNLGAILLDQQKLDEAATVLDQAISAAPDLPQAHANMGRLLLNREQPAAALPDLRSAAIGASTSPPIVASLGEAYRRAGELAEARIAMGQVLALDPDNGPALAEQSMLTLTDVETATHRLEWELEAPPARNAEQLAELRRATETGIASIEALRNEYLRQGAAYGVAARPAMQRLSETQAALLEQELLNRRYQLMLVQIEQGRVLAEQPRSGPRRFWDAITGRRTPFAEAIANGTAALRQEPSLALQYDYHYQQGRAAYLSGNPRLAQTQFDATQQLAETAPATATLAIRPEAHYGRALLLADDGQLADSRTELEAALSADERYFPARLLLAQQAESEQRWADAETQYRWLAANRPWDTASQLKLATALRAQGKIAEAEALLLPLANGGDVDALVPLAAMYRELGNQEQASVVLQRALLADPGSAAVHEEAAQLAIARGDSQLAEVELQKALELEPGRSSAHIALGRLYAGQGRPAEAAEQFEAAVAASIDDPVVHRQLGETLLLIGNADAAVDSFRRSLELAPGAHETHHGLATAYLALGRYDAAADEEQKALDLAGGNYTLAIVGQGDIAREQGRYEEATARYNAALERDPRLAVAYLGLGRAAAAQGRTDIAVTHYRAGLEIEPNNVPLLIGLGDALLQQNDTAGAKAAYTEARAFDLHSAAASAGLGRALWKEGQGDAALLELNQAVSQNPTDAETLLLIGDIHAAANRNEAALTAYNQAADARKDWYEPRFRRGVLELKLQQTDAAIEDLRATVRLSGSFAQGHYWLGRAYRADGSFAEARRELQRAIELQGDYWEARYFLGRTLDELGQAPDAVAAYQAILDGAPSADPWRTEAARELDRIR